MCPDGGRSTMGVRCAPSRASRSSRRTRGIAAYGVSPYPVTYYQSITIHKPDESIAIGSFQEGVEYLRDVVVNDRLGIGAELENGKIAVAVTHRDGGNTGSPRTLHVGQGVSHHGGAAALSLQRFDRKGQSRQVLRATTELLDRQTTLS